MKSQTEAISIRLTREEGVEIRNQILKLLGGDSMALHAELRGTPLAKLFEMLSANFVESHAGIHTERQQGAAP